MSASLHWKPVPKEPEDDYLSHDLMFKLRDRYWDGGGLSLAREITVGPEEVPYLQGLADCGIEDAQTLIDLIKEHGGVILCHKF